MLLFRDIPCLHTSFLSIPLIGYGPRPPTLSNRSLLLVLLSHIILTVMSYSIPHSFAVTLQHNVPDKLDDSNWFIWTKKMMGALRTIAMTGIATGQLPALSPEERKDWDRSDGMLSGYIYGRVSDEYQYLIEDCDTGATAWAALKAHFEKSTIGYRMAAREEFYQIHHDSDCPISAYLQALQSAKQKLAAFGVTIDDTEFKDVLLMHLDDSFHAVRLNILAQSPEPDLAKIKVMLASSTAADPVTIKLEGANAVRGRGSARSSDPLIDDKGNRWCDLNSDGCHRCGRKGHRAFVCIYDMPRSIKDHVMKNPCSGSPSSSSSSTRHAQCSSCRCRHSSYPCWCCPCWSL